MRLVTVIAITQSCQSENSGYCTGPCDLGPFQFKTSIYFKITYQRHQSYSRPLPVWLVCWLSGWSQNPGTTIQWNLSLVTCHKTTCLKRPHIPSRKSYVSDWTNEQRPVFTDHIFMTNAASSNTGFNNSCPGNSVLIREVTFGQREHHIHSLHQLWRIWVLSKGVSFLESVR